MTAFFAATVGPVRADVWSWGVARLGGAEVAVLTTTNAQGAAILSEAELAGKAVDEIAFTRACEGADALVVGGIVLANRQLKFTASVPLLSDGSNSMFSLSGSDGDWTFDGLELRGADGTVEGPAFGGAVDCESGRLTLVGSTFTNLVADQVGGAVCARRMTGDVMVTNCVFVDNAVSPYNGYGGAIYATTVADSSVRLVIRDCVFDGNVAEDGGAVCTRTRLFDDERPIAAEIGDGSVFVGNAAEFEGGAVLAEGDIAISGSNTVFSANVAGNDGGAVCVNGSGGNFTPVKVSISNGVTFAENIVTSQVDWVSGGAISVMQSGCELEVSGAVFSNNLAVATSEGDSAQSALGGAVCTAAGCTNVFRKTAFVGNGVASAAYGVGGAVSVCGGETTVDNCVFDCRGTTSVACYGSAVDFDGTQGLVRNTTIRYGATAGISALDATLDIVNCVAVGNALAMEDGTDFLFEGTSHVEMSYTAYGSCGAVDGATVAESLCLSNRVAEAVYDGDTLRLDKEGFNPVAELGLVQADQTDFDGNFYAFLPAIGEPRASMGAFELGVERYLVLDVFGTRTFDGTTRSNDCVWTWRLTDTNGNAIAYDDLVPTNLAARAASEHLAGLFALTNWVFGTEANGGAVGYYDVTNGTGNAWELIAGAEPLTDRTRWLGTMLLGRYHGEITKSWFVLPVDFGGGETNGVYFTWEWMKDNVDRVPTNDFEESCGILREAETNGYPRWQNYVMGIDGTNPTNRIVTTCAPRDPAAGGSVVTVTTPIAAFNPPEGKTGVEMEYRLYNVTHTRRGILPETSAETWHCYGTNTVPDFVLDLSALHYGLENLDRDCGQCLLEIYAIFKKGEPPTE